MKIWILGVPYDCEYRLTDEDKNLEECDGYCDYSIHRIVVKDYTEQERREPMSMADLEVYKRKCLRHEIVHAFLYESGLSVNASKVDCWATSEEIVDWIAIQGPKIYAAWQQAACLEVMHGGGA